MIRRTRTNKKVAEWLTAIKSNDKHEPQTFSLQPRFRRAEKHYSESSEASSEAAEGAGPRRGGRQRERPRARERGRGRARSEGAGAGKGDPLRVLEELKRLSEDEASPYPSSSSSSAGAPPSPPGPCSRSTSSSGGAALGPSPGRRARRVLRGRSLSPLNFRPARDLSRSALRRIYSLPNDRAARRRRFKEELRRRCGLKVWTWEELVRGGRAALADACRVPSPDDQERLRFRYRSYSPRKMHGVMCGVRAALREDERRVDRLFAELERLMLPADDGPDAADAAGAGAAAALVVERRRLMALRGGRGKEGGGGGGGGEGEGGGGGGGAPRGRFVSDLSLTRAHWVRARSGGAASRARGHAAKAFERRTLLYLDWEPSDASAPSPRTRANKPAEARRKKANAKCKVQEAKRSSHKHPAHKTCELTKIPSKISEFTYSANEKHESKQDNIKLKEDLSHEAALSSVGRRKTSQGARRSAPDAPRGGSLEAPSAAFRLSAAAAGDFHAPAQRQPARLPPLQETVGDKAALCKEMDKNANQKTSARSNSLHKRMQALKNSFSEIKEIHGTGDDRINIYEATSRVLQRTGRQRTSSWTRPPSSKAPLPPLREQRMYARAVACIADSDPFPKKESFAPLGNDSRHATYHF